MECIIATISSPLVRGLDRSVCILQPCVYEYNVFCSLDMYRNSEYVFLSMDRPQIDPRSTPDHPQIESRSIPDRPDITSKSTPQNRMGVAFPVCVYGVGLPLARMGLIQDQAGMYEFRKLTW